MLVVLLASAVVASCSSGSVRVARSAVDETAAVLSLTPEQVVLSADEVSTLAGQVGVSDEVVRTVAPQVDQQPAWSRVITRVRSVDQATDGEIRNTALSLACDAVNGEITSSDELWNSLLQQLEGLSQNELEQAYFDTIELYEDLDEAIQSGDPQTRATVIVMCHTAEQMSG